MILGELCYGRLSTCEVWIGDNITIENKLWNNIVIKVINGWVNK